MVTCSKRLRKIEVKPAPEQVMQVKAWRAECRQRYPMIELVLEK